MLWFRLIPRNQLWVLPRTSAPLLFLLWRYWVKSKLPVLTNKVSIPGKDFKANGSLMIHFFLHRYHHDFLAASGKGNVKMAVESNWLTFKAGCTDHHIARKPRYASRASAAGRNQIVAARAATIKSWKVRIICALARCITVAFACKLRSAGLDYKFRE